MNEGEVLAALVDVWVSHVAPHVRADCCILAARVTSGVLDYYGIGNHVLACELLVYNDAALDEISKGTPVAEWPANAWSLGAGKQMPGDGYAGHVIVRTDSGALVDLSAGQFHRAGRINVDGPRVWRDVEERSGTLVVHDGNTWFGFHPTTDKAYRNAPDWRTARELVGNIIRTMNYIATEKDQ